MQKLTNENINTALKDTETFLRSHDAARKKILAVTLRVEDLLLFYQEKLSADAAFELDFGMRDLHPVVEVSVSGGKFDPRDPQYDSQILILTNLSQNREESFEYAYQGETNVCRFILEKKRSVAENLRFSWKYMKTCKGGFFAGVGTQFANMVLCIVTPILSARIIASLTENALTQVLLAALVLLVVRIFNTLFARLCGIFYNRVYCAVMTGLESDIAESVMDTEMSSIESNGTGLFIERMTNDTKNLSTGFSTLADLTTGLLRHVGTLVAMLILNRWAFLFMLVWIVIVGFIEKKRAIRLEKNVRAQRTASEGVSSLVTEMVRGESDIKLLNLKQSFGMELKRRIEDSNRKLLKTDVDSKVFRIVNGEVTNIFSFLFVALMVFLISKGEITAVTALVLFNYSEELGLSSVDALDSLVEFWRTFTLSCERVMSVISGPRFPKEKFGEKHLDRLSGAIEFEHVSFAYDFENLGVRNRKIINDMSFSIKPGEKVSFVGKSGCGKSTVIGLVSKLRTANSGRILIDGTEIGELDRETVRNGISVVSQSPYLFNMSIRDNLKIVCPDLTEEEMHKVMKQACMDDEVMRMANGYDSILGESGISISGGQRQRVAIARALLRNTPIIIFDEATSALDNTTQKKVQQAIDNLDGRHTILIIAHRLSTVKNSDRIFFMEDGRITATGTHEELLNTCDGYRELATIEYEQ